VLDHSGLMEHYKNDKEGADRVENLEELVSAAESFVTQEGFGRDAVALPVDEVANAPMLSVTLGQSPASQGLEPDSAAPGDTILNQDTGETMSPLAAFLTHAALESGDNQAKTGQDAVQMMTVHSSKGLEFDAVFITGLEEGLFPHENSMNDYDGLEEERRLMYVAITRARKRLYLSLSQTRMLHGQTRYNIKSRFLDELPENVLKWITPKNAGFGSGFNAQASYGSGYGQQGRSNPYANYNKAAADGSDWNKGGFTAGPVPVQAAAPSHGIKAGMQVFHNKFGEGAVISVEGLGDDARAQVKFGRHGVKWLALSVAKLTPV
jgi:DNA helicase II / ATP-dependent DNA helicase PcrA